MGTKDATTWSIVDGVGPYLAFIVSASFALSFAAFLRCKGFNFSGVRAGNVSGSATAGVEAFTLEVRGFALAVLRE